jgi:hypothetical protein
MILVTERGVGSARTFEVFAQLIVFTSTYRKRIHYGCDFGQECLLGGEPELQLNRCILVKIEFFCGYAQPFIV